MLIFKPVHIFAEKTKWETSPSRRGYSKLAQFTDKHYTLKELARKFVKNRPQEFWQWSSKHRYAMSSPGTQQNGSNFPIPNTSFHCSLLNQVIQPPNDVADLSLELIINCVLNILFSLAATVGNAFFMAAIRDTSFLGKASGVLLFSLAMSDFTVGIVLQPLYIIFRLATMLEKPALFCKAIILYNLFSGLALGVSLFTLSAISLDRYMALLLHLRYQAIVTRRRAAILVTVLWLVAGLSSASRLFNTSIFNFMSNLVIISCFVVSVVSYIQIYRTLRRHQAHIKAQLQAVTFNKAQAQAQEQEQEQEPEPGPEQEPEPQPEQEQEPQPEPEQAWERPLPNDTAAFIARERKAAMNSLCAYLVFILCFLPYVGTSTVMAITGLYPSGTYLSLTVMMINSSLNPLVFCWRMPSIRKSMFKMLKGCFRYYWKK